MLHRFEHREKQALCQVRLTKAPQIPLCINIDLVHGFCQNVKKILKAGHVTNSDNLKKELTFLGLIDKGKEIYYELGERAALSYIKSSHRLLSKVYHPDLNPKNTEKATVTQQSLNKLSSLISIMKDEEIIEIFKDPLDSPLDEGAERKVRILIVEDEFGLQEVYKDIFFMEGYDVRVAIDGVNGLEEFKNFQPDLVFTDVVMPNMSGLELISKIREINQSIKVIYVSGFFGIRRLKQELDIEISRYGYPTLAKPFKTSEMLALVKEYLAG
jgi:CheY-like chemotaxis protein